MKLTKFVSILMFCCSINVHAELISDVLISGKIVKVDKKIITIRDELGQKHKVPLEQIQKKHDKDKLLIGTRVSFIKKVNPSQPAFDFRLNKGIKLDEQEKRKIYGATIKFMTMIDEKMRAKQKGYKTVEGELEGKTTSIFDKLDMNLLWQILIPNAQCELSSQTDCIFGGWPSRSESESGLCTVPWSTGATARNGGNAGSGYTPCGGGDNVFRCNPDIFGPGIRGSNGGFNESRAVDPYPGSPVKVFPTSDPERGFCVNTDAGDSIIYQCLRAAQQNMPNLMRNFSVQYYHERFMPLYHSYCGRYICPEGQSLHGTNCVATCPEGTTLNATERRCDTTPAEGAPVPAATTGAAITDGGRQTECQYMAMQIENVNFHDNSQRDRTRCNVQANTRGPIANCRSVYLVCQRGGRLFSGYMGYSDFRNRKVRENGTEVNFHVLANRIGGDWVNGYDDLDLNFAGDFKLYNEACVADADRDEHEVEPNFTTCTANSMPVESLGESFRPNISSQSAACTGDFCVVGARCLEAAPPADAEGDSDTVPVPENPLFYDVNLVCRCTPDQLSSNPSSPINIENCSRDQILQITPETEGEIRFNNTNGAGGVSQ